MSRKVVPLHPPAEPEEDLEARPQIIPRIVSHPPQMNMEQLAVAYQEHERLILRHEARLTAFAARVLIEGLPPMETWVAAVLTSPDGDPEDELIEIAAREVAVEIAEPWPAIHRGLLEPGLPDRLDVLIEAREVVGLMSLGVTPALPVTRKQAEAANLPAHLLFARGDAFASIGEEPADKDKLAAAYLEHRRLLEESAEELLDQVRRVGAGVPLEECVGVLLALGPEGHAVSAVPRAKAERLVVDKPFLARQLKRGGASGSLPDGRDILSIPIVVWAKGHVSVQTREVVEAR